MATALVNTPAIDKDDLELLRLLAEGLTVELVAKRMNLSVRTVRRRARSICDRLDMDAPIQAVVWAARKGLL